MMPCGPRARIRRVRGLEMLTRWPRQTQDFIYQALAAAAADRAEERAQPDRADGSGPRPTDPEDPEGPSRGCEPEEE